MPQPSSTALGTGGSGASGGSGAATNSIVIDLSSMGGLAAGFYGDSDQTVALPNRRILVDDTNTNQLAQGYFNPWMRQGYLSPSVATNLPMTFLSGSPTNVLASVEYDPLGDVIYFAEGDVKASGGSGIYTANENGSVPFSFNNSVLTKATTVFSLGTNVNITDLQVYTLNGLRTLFYSFTYTSSGTLKGGIGATDLTGLLSGATYVDGWFQGTATYNGSDVTNPITTLASTFPFMRLGSNGLMYIFDGSVVHQLDGTVLGGTAGTLTQDIFGIAPQDNIVDAIAFRQLMYLACQSSAVNPRVAPSNGVNYNGNCYVEVWNETVGTSASSTVVTDIIAVPGVKSIQKLYISPTDTLRMICVSANGLTQIREYNGTQFTVLMQLGLGASPQYPDSLTVADALTIWISNDGCLYAHGTVLNQTPEVVAKIGAVVQVGVGSANPEVNLPKAGAIIYGASTESSGVVAGYRQDIQGVTLGYLPQGGSSSAMKIFPFDKGSLRPDGDAAAINQQALIGNIYTGVHFLESSTASFYTGTRFLSQLSTIGFINIFMAASGTDTADTTVQATIRLFFNGSTTQWGAGKTITRHDISVGYKRIEINQPYINTVQLKIEYTTNSTLNDSFDFHPYTAVVYYSPTNTRG